MNRAPRPSPDSKAQTTPVLGVIPARWGSTRLPGKPLLDLHGKPLIQWVWERAREARSLDRLVVATDDEKIAAAVAGFGGEAVLTSPAHLSGTDRAAEAARLTETSPAAWGIVANIQGDEPLLDPLSIDRAVGGLGEEDGISTLCEPFPAAEEVLRPQCVKVVADPSGRALYFSRAPVPWIRGARDAADLLRRLEDEPSLLALYRRHVGLYVFRREALDRFVALPPSPLERAEGLEQLRALEAGIPIRVLDAPGRAIGVDTPEDLERVRALLDPTLQPTRGGEGWRRSSYS